MRFKTQLKNPQCPQVSCTTKCALLFTMGTATRSELWMRFDHCVTVAFFGWELEPSRQNSASAEQFANLLPAVHSAASFLTDLKGAPLGFPACSTKELERTPALVCPTSSPLSERTSLPGTRKSLELPLPELVFVTLPLVP